MRGLGLMLPSGGRRSGINGNACKRLLKGDDVLQRLAAAVCAPCAIPVVATLCKLRVIVDACFLWLTWATADSMAAFRHAYLDLANVCLAVTMM